MSQMNSEHVAAIQRHLNNGNYEEAVNIINITLCNSQGPSPLVEQLVPIVPQLFPSLHVATDEYIENCCNALEKLLQMMKIETIISQMEVQMKQGFEHPSSRVKILCLKQLQRAVSDRRNLKLIAEVGMMKHGILLLSSEDSAVVKMCHKTLLTLAGYDEGVIILYSDQGLKLLDEVASTSDTNRYRVFDVLIDSIMVSDQALDFCNHSGLTGKILEDLESPDILLRMSAIENVSRLADSPGAYTTMSNRGIFKGIAAWLSLNTSDANYLVPSIVKLYAKLAQKHNVNIQALSTECPEYLNCVSQLVEHPDPSIRCACIDVFTILGSREDGKCALIAANNTVKKAVPVIASYAARGTELVKDRSIVALAHIFSAPDVFLPEFSTIAEAWLTSCPQTLLKDLLPAVNIPSASTQCAVSSFLANLAAHRWGLRRIVKVSGWSERLLDRGMAVDRECQERRYGAIVAINNSPAAGELLDSTTLAKLSQYISEGAHYKEVAPRTALEL